VFHPLFTLHIPGNGDQRVYRQCWNLTTVEPYTPEGCVEDDIRGGSVCRCTGHACNGQQQIRAGGFVFFSTVLCAILFRSCITNYNNIDVDVKM